MHALLNLKSVVTLTFSLSRMAYGFRAHLMNLGIYSLGLIPLTLLVTHIQPGRPLNGTELYEARPLEYEVLFINSYNLFKIFTPKRYDYLNNV